MSEQAGDQVLNPLEDIDSDSIVPTLVPPPRYYSELRGPVTDPRALFLTRVLKAAFFLAFIGTTKLKTGSRGYNF